MNPDLMKCEKCVYFMIQNATLRIGKSQLLAFEVHSYSGCSEWVDKDSEAKRIEEKSW